MAVEMRLLWVQLMQLQEAAAQRMCARLAMHWVTV
jgi:hypothetical protein